MKSIGRTTARAARIGLLAATWCASAAAFARGVLEWRLDVRLGFFRLAVKDPSRALAAAALLVVLYLALYGGEIWKGRDGWLARKGWVAAGVLAVATLAVALRWATYAATWADPSGYVSQAELWLRGSLRIDQAWVAAFDWPRVNWVFSPLGYRPAGSGHVIVPIYAAGMPILMALAKLAVGAGGPFVVAPILGALGVWLTYRFGRTLLSEEEGLVAACLLATSPVFLTHVLFPMSDVAAMTCWTLSAVLLLAGGGAAPILAGLAASMAVVIRPNLAPLAGVFVVAILTRTRRTEPRRDEARRLHRGAGGWIAPPAAFEAGRYLAGVVPGIVFVLALQAYLYGSPLQSGYGGASDLYALSRGWQNLRLYAGWLYQAHGVLALLIPLGLLIPGAVPLMARRGAPGAAGGVSPKLLVVGVTAAVWLCYLFYYSFDDRFFLRFLLPAWPMMSVAAAGTLAWISRPAPARWRPLLVLALGIVMSLVQWRAAVGAGVFRWQESEHRYVEVARAVSTATPSNAMILAMQHSGSLRYYTGRPTLRYDELAPGLLDKAVADLAAKGYRPYAVLEDFEVEVFRQRFASNRAGGLRQDPLNNGMPPRAFMFDLLEAGRGARD